MTLVAPYAAWMVLMWALPQTAWAYAVRGCVSALLLCVTACVHRGGLRSLIRRSGLRGVFWGLLAGLLVFLIWIAPETWLWPSVPPSEPSPYDPSVCGWTLTLAKLAASAFVISVAEELFFRKWLVDFAGFWWMVALFAVEHGERWHVGAITGIVYGLLARRYGLLSAIVAHAVTNFVLGGYVIRQGAWQFW